MTDDLLDGFDEGDVVGGPETADSMPTVDTIIERLSRLPASLRARPLLVSAEHETWVVTEVTNAGILHAQIQPF